MPVLVRISAFLLNADRTLNWAQMPSASAGKLSKETTYSLRTSSTSISGLLDYRSLYSTSSLARICPPPRSCRLEHPRKSFRHKKAGTTKSGILCRLPSQPVSFQVAPALQLSEEPRFALSAKELFLFCLPLDLIIARYSEFVKGVGRKMWCRLPGHAASLPGLNASGGVRPLVSLEWYWNRALVRTPVALAGRWNMELGL